MFVQTVLEEIKIKAEYPPFRFLFMFIGVVAGALIATGVRDFSVLEQPSLTWSFLAIALFVTISLTLGCGMFWQKATKLSLLSLPVIANRRK